MRDPGCRYRRPGSERARPGARAGWARRGRSEARRGHARLAGERFADARPDIVLELFLVHDRDAAEHVARAAAHAGDDDRLVRVGMRGFRVSGGRWSGGIESVVPPALAPESVIAAPSCGWAGAVTAKGRATAMAAAERRLIGSRGLRGARRALEPMIHYRKVNAR